MLSAGRRLPNLRLSLTAKRGLEMVSCQNLICPLLRCRRRSVVVADITVIVAVVAVVVTAVAAAVAAFS